MPRSLSPWTSRTPLITDGHGDWTIIYYWTQCCYKRQKKRYLTFTPTMLMIPPPSTLLGSPEMHVEGPVNRMGLQDEEAGITSLLHSISSLEQKHKAATSPSTLTSLTALRNALQDLLNQKSLTPRDKFRLQYFYHENKPGKLLARAIHPRRALAAIPMIRDLTNKPVYSPRDISQIFQTFYCKLYNLYNLVGRYNSLDPEELRHKVK